MNGLREKFRNKKGFTLIEMLIVVAIIAILVAISIPLVGEALERARDATDQANERAAKAQAAIKYLGADSDMTIGKVKGDFYYDAKNGTLVAASSSEAWKIATYGQCSDSHTDGTSYGDSTDVNNKANGPHTGKIIKVTIGDGGSVGITWEAPPAKPAGP